MRENERRERKVMATTSLSYNTTENTHTLIDTDKMPDWERLEKRREQMGCA